MHFIFNLLRHFLLDFALTIKLRNAFEVTAWH